MEMLTPAVAVAPWSCVKNDSGSSLGKREGVLWVTRDLPQDGKQDCSSVGGHKPAISFNLSNDFILPPLPPLPVDTD